MHDNFLSDDWDFLYISSHHTKPISDYFLKNYYGNTNGGTYRPLVVFYWIFSYKIFGLNSAWYHLSNILFHILNLILLWKIGLNLLKQNQNKTYLAVLIAGLFFIFSPNHSETVIWTAAINDTAMTALYLTSWLFYIKYLKFEKIWYLFFSLTMLILSILTKEMAMTLPFTLLITHLFICKKQTFYQIKKTLKLGLFFIILALFFLLRYNATGLFLGYYGNNNIGFDLIKFLNSYLGITISHFFSDNIRINILRPFLENSYFTYILFFSILTVFLINLKKILLSYAGLFLSLFVFSILPLTSFTVNAPFGYYSDEGERYAYLPSVFFALFIGVMLSNLFFITKKRVTKILLVLLLAIIFSLQGFQLIKKNMRWHISSDIATRLINQTVELYNKNKFDGLVFFGIPDSNHGAFIFHNNWLEALKMHGLDKTIILSVFAKTLYDEEEIFIANKIDSVNFFYETNSKNKLILSPIDYKSGDYSLKLLGTKNYIFSPNFKHSGNKLLINIEKQWLQNEKLATLYFNGYNWQSLK